MWIKEFQLALVLKDVEKFTKLMECVPNFTDKKEIDTLLCLVEEAKLLVEGLQDETRISMIQMKKNLNFLNATQAPHTSKLDINS
ncbi:hypothetical protein JHD47_08025 [Sulfurimonas sp. SAG-AH-194-L11]|nr:hypothetical protein [Sulfurimonas sp. SAG-AH-194-L11]MDF1877762.1 hypothetical protein [Sulfurimonas sp. SAG-AH-194-L11]